jgi:hypothetical protein
MTFSEKKNSQLCRVSCSINFQSVFRLGPNEQQNEWHKKTQWISLTMLLSVYFIHRWTISQQSISSGSDLLPTNHSNSACTLSIVSKQQNKKTTVFPHLSWFHKHPVICRNRLTQVSSVSQCCSISLPRAKGKLVTLTCSMSVGLRMLCTYIMNQQMHIF